MGDRKPVRFARELDRLMAAISAEAIKARIFHRSLPKDIRMAISGSGNLSYRQLVAAANSAWEKEEERFNASGINTIHSSERGRFWTAGPQPAPRQAFPPPQEREPSSFGKSSPSSLCRYHQCWGDKARKCAPNCPRWSDKNRQVFVVEEEDEQNPEN